MHLTGSLHEKNPVTKRGRFHIRCEGTPYTLSVNMHFFLIQFRKPLRHPVRPICGLVLFDRSISLILYIVDPYRASVAAGTP